MGAGKIVMLDTWHRNWVKTSKPAIDLRGRRMPLKLIRYIEHQGYFKVVAVTMERSISKLTDVADMCPQLRILEANGCPFLTTVQGLQACKGLVALDLSQCDYLTLLPPLAACLRLHTVDLSHCARLFSVAGLAGCLSLTSLNLEGCDALED